MTNKYLEKIAKASEGERHYVGGALVTGVGAKMMHNQYHDGNLTGRATYYHGSNAHNIRKIKEHGIVPRASKGVIDGMNEDFAKKNEGLAFATKSKFNAHHYARQSEKLRKGPYFANLDPMHGINTFKRYAKDNIGLKKDPRVVRLDLPTWRNKIKSKVVRNPELDNIQVIMGGPAIQKELGENTITHKGKISAKFIRGSKHYKGNSSREILSFIKNNPGRFAKGVGMTVAGAGLIGAGIYGGSRLDKGPKK